MAGRSRGREASIVQRVEAPGKIKKKRRAGSRPRGACTTSGA
jgi:hypothetical protein